MEPSREQESGVIAEPKPTPTPLSGSRGRKRSSARAGSLRTRTNGVQPKGYDASSSAAAFTRASIDDDEGASLAALSAVEAALREGSLEPVEAEAVAHSGSGFEASLKGGAIPFCLTDWSELWFVERAGLLAANAWSVANLYTSFNGAGTYEYNNK